MRRVLIGMLMAASAATPLAAQDAREPDGGVVLTPRYERQAQRNAARAERREQRQEARGTAVQAQNLQQRQQRSLEQQQAPIARAERRADRFEQRQDLRQDRRGDRIEQRQDLRQDRRADRIDQRQDLRQDRREALREQIRDSRAASRESAAGVIPSYQRQAARNQQRYEERLREDFRDRQDLRRDRRELRRDVRQDRRDYRQDRRDYRDWSRSWNRGWRADRRYDWQCYRTTNRYLFSPGRYYAPYRNYSYQRFNIGFVLDPLFFSDRYRLNDPWQYRLPPAYDGTHWVRYYDDVLLVDSYTGEVIDVIHDFFW